MTESRVSVPCMNRQEGNRGRPVGTAEDEETFHREEKGNWKVSQQSGFKVETNLIRRELLPPWHMTIVLE